MKIVEIRKSENEKVYDFTVDKDFSYQAEGVFHHNSGKDWVSRIIILRQIYKLLNLKSPQEYYGLSKNSHFFLINVAPSGDNAEDAFFSELRSTVQESKYFQKMKVKITNNEVVFPKNLHCLSTNSSFASFEGLNVFSAVLDEIDEFRSKDEMRGAPEAREKKTAEGIYQRASVGVTSRFSGYGKVILLSWPRYKDSFIQQRRKKGLLEPRTYVACKPNGDPYASWEVHPAKTREMYADEYARDPLYADAVFACKPQFAEDMFFRDKDALLRAFDAKLTDTDLIVVNKGLHYNHFNEIMDGTYEVDGSGVLAMHIDLALSKNKAALGIAHKMSEQKTETGEYDSIIKLDAVKYYYPGGENHEIILESILEDVINIKKRGYPIYKVTLDHFQSAQFKQMLNKFGIKSDFLSLDRTPLVYDTFQDIIYSNNLIAFYDEIAINEMLRLQKLYTNKIVSQGTFAKDASDGIAGAVYNAHDMPMNRVWVSGNAGEFLNPQDKNEKTATPTTLVPPSISLCYNCVDRIVWSDEKEKQDYLSYFDRGIEIVTNAVCIICGENIEWQKK